MISALEFCFVSSCFVSENMSVFREVSGFIDTHLIDGTKVDTYRPFDSAGPVNKTPCPPQSMSPEDLGELICLFLQTGKPGLVAVAGAGM